MKHAIIVFFFSFFAASTLVAQAIQEEVSSETITCVFLKGLPYYDDSIIEFSNGSKSLSRELVPFKLLNVIGIPGQPWYASFSLQRDETCRPVVLIEVKKWMVKDIESLGYFRPNFYIVETNKE